MKQTDLEAEMRDLGIARYKNKVQRTRHHEMESQHPVGKRLLEESVLKLTEGINRWKVRVEKSGAGNRHSAHQYITLLPANLVAALTARTVIDAISIHKRLVRTAMDVAKALEEEIRCREMREKDPTLWRHGVAMVRQIGRRDSKRRHLDRTAKLMDLQFSSWPQADRLKVGTVLVELMRTSTGLIDITTRTGLMGKRDTFVKATDETAAWLKSAHAYREDLSPVFMPMTVPPHDWTNIWSGGYLTDLVTQQPVVKTRSRAHLRELSAMPMDEPLETVNILQRVAWRTNDEVVDVLTHCWENNVEVAGVPGSDGQAIPTKPDDIDTNLEARRDWRKRAARVHAANDADVSRRIQVARVLWLLKKFRGSDVYFPWYLDFRGRFYPKPFYLQPQAADSSRSMLKFKHGCNMTGTADKWAAIHGANCAGHDKLTLADRQEWTHQNSELICDVANDPLGTVPVWSQMDEPWAFLAFCKEWAGYLAEGSSYEWHTPVSIDGSSNGLQLFSLVMRDPVGAMYTNVTPPAAYHPTPRDIYQEVADRAVFQLTQQASTCDISRRWVDFGINRKCAKRPCMVVPYSGTLFAVKQYTMDWYHDEIKARKTEGPFADMPIFHPTRVLAEALWFGIGQVVGQARQAMAWLQSVSDVCVEHGVTPAWYAPNGFYCRQGYEKYRHRSVKTIIGEKIRQHRLREGTGVLDAQKNRNGFVPNWIHSLDAAIAGGSTRKSRAAGVKSLSWTHDSAQALPGDMELVRDNTLQTVIETFEHCPMQSLIRDIEPLLPPGVSVPEPPAVGVLDINVVAHSDYFFS